MDTLEALELLQQAKIFHLQHYLGAHREERKTVNGVTFRVWAQMRKLFILVGDLPNWVENQIPMVSKI